MTPCLRMFSRVWLAAGKARSVARMRRRDRIDGSSVLPSSEVIGPRSNTAPACACYRRRMPAPTRLAAVARLRRWLTYALTALIVALVAVALIAPHFIDAPAARAEIQRRLDEALGGQISWQALEVRLLPVPHG